ncbi:MAG: gluconate 2-dehydrogenase subunit 3 family protein [Gammaproteobacteria bacterium]|nr:gluconate 2-dehydrogenase subunit 3 family protein [Gammaproteobacteria bacterium]MDH3577326.1 gluconate 2-dehydrogenase subunit 3 family protein [Gammaproteobacteria bacterium]
MKNNKVSRRQFLKSSSALTGASLLRISAPSMIAITQAACTAKRAQAAYKVLTVKEAADFAAIAARIIPTTDTPGATEAGVIHFFDNAFAAEMSKALSSARAGLAEFNAALTGPYPGASGFPALPTDEQDAFLTSRESSQFFDLCRAMTIFGFFSMSKYGGNKDHMSWDLIGFEGRHGAWEYPFGYYDAEHAKERFRGE